MTNHHNKQKNKPYPSYKDPGVEWLGKIPKHWEVKRLKFISEISTGERDTEDKMQNGSYPFFVRSQTIERINSWSFNGEAVLTAGDGVGVAKVFHYVNGKFDFHQRVYKFSNFKYLNGKFFFYYIKELFKEEVIKLSAKSTVDSLRLPMVSNFIFCIPKKKEQKQIVDFLDKETSRIDSLTERIKKSIELLKEYRSALITSAVTGKIDVRESQEEITNVVQIQRSKKEASPLFKKTVLGAEIVAQLKDTPHFGRTKFMKTIYLCEAHLQIPLKGTYKREAAGPLDNSIYKMEGIMKRNKWFEVIKTGSMYKYKPLENLNNYKPYFDKYWGDHTEKLNQFLSLAKKFTTEQSEIVDTIYAVWNDFLMEGKTPSDNEIVNEVKNNWHKSKKRFSAEKLKKAIQWMKEQNLIPQGYGQKTKK
ncbi:MAG: restriction endonuclease subunit S [Bdellovibrionales bacterium]|nr:restriction endonuclease subunit S [Bdellovibrionales bacterium]